MSLYPGIDPRESLPPIWWTDPDDEDPENIPAPVATEETKDDDSSCPF